MKRFISTLLILFTLTVPFFAADSDDDFGDDYDDNYVYESNGNGDQFLKFSFMANFPLNFTNIDADGNKIHQLYTGAAFDLGYYRFFNSWFAVGGELTFASNWSIGEDLLCTVPITPGVLFQPSIGNFEFPIFINMGVGFESWANAKYFPSLATKVSAGAYYRITESWSAGITGNGMWVPQWFAKHPEWNFNALFASVSVGGRFHF